MKAGQHRVALLLHTDFVVRVFLFRPDGNGGTGRCIAVRSLLLLHGCAAGGSSAYSYRSLTPAE